MMSTSAERDSKERFALRVKNYARHRPRYPDALIDRLLEFLGNAEEPLVADIGSGTEF